MYTVISLITTYSKPFTKWTNGNKLTRYVAKEKNILTMHKGDLLNPIPMPTIGKHYFCKLSKWTNSNKLTRSVEKKEKGFANAQGWLTESFPVHFSNSNSDAYDVSTKRL